MSNFWHGPTGSCHQLLPDFPDHAEVNAMSCGIEMADESGYQIPEEDCYESPQQAVQTALR